MPTSSLITGYSPEILLLALFLMELIFVVLVYKAHWLVWGTANRLPATFVCSSISRNPLLARDSFPFIGQTSTRGQWMGKCIKLYLHWLVDPKHLGKHRVMLFEFKSVCIIYLILMCVILNCVHVLITLVSTKIFCKIIGFIFPTSLNSVDIQLTQLIVSAPRPLSREHSLIYRLERMVYTINWSASYLLIKWGLNRLSQPLWRTSSLKLQPHRLVCSQFVGFKQETCSIYT